MVKFELLLCSSTLSCLSIDNDKTAKLLGANIGSPISSLLADEQEVEDLKNQIQNLVEESKTNPDAFCTFNLVFSAPGASTDSLMIDRSAINGVFRSPIRAIHMSQEQQICCLVHIQMGKQDNNDNDNDNQKVIRLTAMEFSRKYRERMLRNEFGSWLLEDHIEQAVIATDPVGTVVFWNRFASELYQYSQQEAMGQNIMNLTPSQMTQEQGMEIFSKLVKGEHWKGFFGVQRKDKSRFMAHVTDTPVLDPEGQLKFIVGVSADYTPMHDLMDTLQNLNANLEQEVDVRTKALLEREQSLRMVGAAVKESDTGVIIADEGFRIVWSNEAAQNLLQMSPDEMGNVLPWNLPLEYETIATDETKDQESMVKEFFQSNNHIPMEAYVKSPNNNDSDSDSDSDIDDRLCLSIRVQAMKGCHNRMIVLRDMTTEKEADEAHRRAEKEAAASRTKTEMMQMLSHEFRTPLQGIMGVVSTILMDMEEQNCLYESLSTIAASSRLLLTLINNILDLGKMDADKMQTVELSPVSLHASIQDAVTFCEPFAKMNECNLVIEDQTQQQQQQQNNNSSSSINGNPSCCSTTFVDSMVLANRLRLEQIMINLVSNAVKYSGEGKEVQIGVRLLSKRDAVAEALNAGASDLKMLSREDVNASLANNEDTPVAVVTVRDQGKGIPVEEFGSLFGEFSQLAISKEKDNSNNNRSGSNRKRNSHVIGQSSGSGLGLNLVLKFVALMKGHIWVTNCPTGGAEFHFCFPQADSPAPIPGKREVVAPQKSLLRLPKLDSEIGGSVRILLLDDTLINLKVLKKMLGRLGVGHVQIFTDGSKALASMRRTKSAALLPTLIFSDLEMPGMSGFDFLRQLKKETVYHESPTVIACSADWTPETEQRCLNAGFDGFLRKPIILAALRDFLVSHVQCQKHLDLPKRDLDLSLLESDFACLQPPNSKPKGSMDDCSSKISLADMMATNPDVDCVSFPSMDMTPSA